MAGASERPLEPCNSLWIGPLGALERACLRSVVRQGHAMNLYSYRELAGVPEGVTLRDAAAILPESAIIRHRSGSVALFANRFRYELQRLGKGLWLDTDQYLLAPVPPGDGHLFGWQDERHINTSVLRIPPHSPMLSELLALFEERTIPFWLPPGARLAAWLRRAWTGRAALAHMPWGTAGPRALTALARRHGFLVEALAPEVFSPVHYHDAGWIRDPGRFAGLDDRAGDSRRSFVEREDQGVQGRARAGGQLPRPAAGRRRAGLGGLCAPDFW